jgi:hypothetical protein
MIIIGLVSPFVIVNARLLDGAHSTKKFLHSAAASLTEWGGVPDKMTLTMPSDLTKVHSITSPGGRGQ